MSTLAELREHRDKVLATPEMDDLRRRERRVRELLGYLRGSPRLRVPHNGDAAQFISARGESYFDPISLSEQEARDVMDSGYMVKLTKDRDNGKLGWRESGMDGDVADWWVFKW